MEEKGKGNINDQNIGKDFILMDFKEKHIRLQKLK